MGLSVSVRNQMLAKHFGRSDYTAPATLYAAAFIGSSEVTGNGYARVAYTNDTTGFPAPIGGVTTNGVQIDFPIATPAGYSGSVDSIRFYDATSGGNEIGRSDTFTGKNVGLNAFLSIPAGQLTIPLT